MTFRPGPRKYDYIVVGWEMKLHYSAAPPRALHSAGFALMEIIVQLPISRLVAVCFYRGCLGPEHNTIATTERLCYRRIEN